MTRNGKAGRYILQRLNAYVFKDPVALMDNVHRVTRHQRKKLKEAGTQDAERRALTLVPARDGATHFTDGEGNVWRTYGFIEGAGTYDTIRNPSQATQAAKAFGEFQKQLVDLPGKRLFETIPNFHHPPKRFEALENAIQADSGNRAAAVRSEIEFA